MAVHQAPSTSRFVQHQKNEFINSIEEEFKRVLRYEDSVLQTKAKAIIPLGQLQVRAINNIREHQRAIKEGIVGDGDLDYDDALLIELLNWFKESFFKWVDKPECDFCNSQTKFHNNSSVVICNSTLRKEVYQCVNCEKLVDFVRYQNPLHLLQTRRGRCGEWANCFTLLCRALGYDARYVLDVTDHVWTEVYSYNQGKWIHCDPCENVIDTPLMYESGWGKKMEYVIAYSKDEVQDVTWRYSSEHKALFERRKRCSEAELVDAIVRLRKARLDTVSKARASFVLRRSVQELVELMFERKPNDKEFSGRRSGSLNWRVQRGECKVFTPFVWTLSTEGCYNLEYFTGLNKYELRNDSNVLLKSVDGWLAGIFKCENLFRKEEHDWKNVYLARNEKTDEATASWKVAAPENLVFKDLVVKVSSFTCESGAVIWTLCAGDSCVKIPKEVNTFHYPAVSGHNEFTLTAKLSGGNGSTAWQHAQICRQALDSLIPTLQIFLSLQRT